MVNPDYPRSIPFDELISLLPNFRMNINALAIEFFKHVDRFTYLGFYKRVSVIYYTTIITTTDIFCGQSHRS